MDVILDEVAPKYVLDTIEESFNSNETLKELQEKEKKPNRNMKNYLKVMKNIKR